MLEGRQGGSGLAGLGCFGGERLGWLSSECVQAGEIRLQRQTEEMINFSSLHTVSRLSFWFSLVSTVQPWPDQPASVPQSVLGCKEKRNEGWEGTGEGACWWRGRHFHQILRWNLLAGMP